MNKFDRVGDWGKFSDHMTKYLQGAQEKYGHKGITDLCHYTGLRVMVWNILKYALRLWNCSGKTNDFSKIAHYAQMGWTIKERQGRKPPFFKEDIEGDYVIIDSADPVMNEADENRIDALKNRIASDIPEPPFSIIQTKEDRIDELYRTLDLIDNAMGSIDRAIKGTIGAALVGNRFKENLIKARDAIVKAMAIFQAT